MELLLTSSYFVIKQGDFSLWCDRYSGVGKLVPKRDAFNPGYEGPIACIGYIYGFIGKIRFFIDGHWYLIVITKQSKLPTFSDSSVFRIERVSLLPLTPNFSLESLELDLPPSVKRSDIEAIFNEFLTSHTDYIEANATPTIPSSLLLDQERTVVREIIRRDKVEIKLCETFIKMFSDSNFYYSVDCDLTNSLQRKFDNNTESFSWKTLDDRFFWNRSMLEDLFFFDNDISQPWILPIIQGFYGTASFSLNLDSIPSSLTKTSDLYLENTPEILKTRSDSIFSDFEDISIDLEHSQPDVSQILHLTLISRRSRYRAGTRYKRRGIDSKGFVANFVESELIILIGSQKCSYVQVRGSIPIFWSQSGPKYKPLPQITSDFQTTQRAFEQHFSHQIKIYEHESIINLVDELGKEALLKDEFESHFRFLDCPFLNYFHFDFHKQCKSFQFSKLENIFHQIEEQFTMYKFFWINDVVDQQVELLCKQQGVFRVNCMDCLDRTNVIQSIIARRVLDLVLMKLGFLMPDQVLPPPCLLLYRKLWADNGDAISRQYAGTAAMKGDLTRTGHRNLKGTVKDGLSSANRYFINHFKDTLKQKVIDSMQDDFGTDFMLSEHMLLNQANNEIGDNIYTLLMLAVRDYLELGDDIRCWTLKELDSFKCISSDSTDQVCVLLLLNFGIIVLLYEVSNDQFLSFEIVDYKSIEKVQLGTFNKYMLLDRKHAIRIYYNMDGLSGFHFSFCSLHARTDDMHLELSIIYNEIKFNTTRLSLYPIYILVKLTNQLSNPHIITKIVESNPDEKFKELKMLIKDKSFEQTVGNQKVLLNNDMKATPTTCVSSSNEDLLSNNYEMPHLYRSHMRSVGKQFYEFPFHDEIDPIFPIRRSVSDKSMYSFATMTGIGLFSECHGEISLHPPHTDNFIIKPIFQRLNVDDFNPS